jgi:hypothetical protein
MTKQANLPELQSRLGHASFKTTVDVYGRMVTDVSDNALDAFAAMRGATSAHIESPPHVVTIEQ